QFAFTHFLHSIVHDTQQIEIFILNRKHKSPAEQEISHQHGNLIFPKSIHRKETTSVIRFINHIIMYQGSGMQQLDEGCSAKSRLINCSTSSGTQEYKHGSHLFPFSLHDVTHDFVQQKHTGFHGSSEFQFKIFHFVGYWSLNIIEAQ